MEILNHSKTNIYGDDIRLFFTVPIVSMEVKSIIGVAVLIGNSGDGGWRVFANECVNEVVSFECKTSHGTFFTMKFDGLGDYEIS